MSELVRPDGARIHYQVHGSGFPVLLLAPGGVSSQVEAWQETCYDPVRELAEHFRVITMDQRHAGRSPAPALPFSYEQTAGDQLAVLDELGVEQAHVVSADTGCLQAWRLAWEAPERVRSAVCQEPPGRAETNTIGTFYAMFDEAMRMPRAEGMRGVVAAAQRDGRFDRNPGAGPFAQRLHDDPDFREEMQALTVERYIVLVVRFRDGLWPAESPYFSVEEEWMAGFPAPMLVLPGDDPMHPEAVSKRLMQEVPDVRGVDPGFADPSRRESTAASVLHFLRDNTPN